MKKYPLITLSIVSHGDADKINTLLNSIQTYEPETSTRFQLILTDNLKDQLPDFAPVSWHSFSMLRNEHPLGFAENHNRAFELAQGEYFAILNPDIAFECPIFADLLASLQHYEANLVAPQIVDKAGIIQDSFRPFPTPFELFQRRLPDYKPKPYFPDQNGMIHPDWVAGMFWLVRSESYRQLGGMDKRFRLYLEDVDFCARARLSGMKIIVDSNIKVRHDAQRASRRNLYYLYLHFQSAFRFFLSPIYRQIGSKRNGVPYRLGAKL